MWNTILGYGGMTLTALRAGTIALALNCGAYMAENDRASIESVDPGQMEAAVAQAYLLVTRPFPEGNRV